MHFFAFLDTGQAQGGRGGTGHTLIILYRAGEKGRGDGRTGEQGQGGKRNGRQKDKRTEKKKENGTEDRRTKEQKKKEKGKEDRRTEEQKKDKRDGRRKGKRTKTGGKGNRSKGEKGQKATTEAAQSGDWKVVAYLESVANSYGWRVKPNARYAFRAHGLAMT